MGKCCCRWQSPRYLRYIPPTIVCCIIIWLYGSFVYYAQPILLYYFHVSIYQISMFHSMAFLLTMALVQCLLSQESFAEKRTKASGPHEQDISDVVETKADGGRRFCRHCRVWKADRMHHCSTCKRCVLKLDHHCTFINKCIGYHNYKFFLQFLGWSALTTLLEASLIFRYLLLDSLDYMLTLYFHGRLEIFSPSLQIVLIFIMSACLGAALFAFFLLHLYFTSINQTTLEFCEKRRDLDYVNYFNIGVIGNLQQVFGHYFECIYWLLPLATPSVVDRGGLSFPMNEVAKKRK